MATFRGSLPQLSGDTFLTDGGIETWLIFHDGIDLPYFAAFTLLKTMEGRDTLRRYYHRYAALAADRGLGFILESPTWRASRDWGDKLGYDADAIAAVNRQAIEMMKDMRERYETPWSPFVVSGCVGPRGDGYVSGETMSMEAARAYHAHQIGAFAEAGADMVTAITMTNVAEAAGLARAAKLAGMPCAISLTVETDGRLPSGEEIGAAIEAVDAATGAHPAYYMINCAHPTHFAGALARGEAWLERVRGVRANASTKSHAELDEATSLDEGDMHDLAERFAELKRIMPNLNVLGGCCGTDHRHVEAIRDAVVGKKAAAA
jgi:S-methylmethionine-dependent homocysteine/selenocysteine methylase